MKRFAVMLQTPSRKKPVWVSHDESILLEVRYRDQGNSLIGATIDCSSSNGTNTIRVFDHNGSTLFVLRQGTVAFIRGGPNGI